MSEPLTVTLTVNGRDVTRTVPSHTTLLAWLRDHASIYDPKPGCGEGVCGACTVLVDGEPVSGCLVLAAQVDGAEVRTLSGLSRGVELTSLQRAFLERGAAQCGFCTPGMLMVATALLEEGRPLDRDEIRDAIHGNLCRCTGYQGIVSAIADVAGGGEGDGR